VTELALPVGTTLQIGQSTVRLLAVYPSGAAPPPQQQPSLVSQPKEALRQRTKKQSGGKAKWFVALFVSVILAGVPFLPHNVVASLHDDEENILMSAVLWWHGVWRGDRMEELEKWAYSACECTQFTCMEAQSLQFLTLLEKYGDGDGETITLNAELHRDFEKGAKCLNDIAVKTFEDQSAAICACEDAACAQREAANLDQLLKSVAKLRNLGSEDASSAVQAAVAKGTRCFDTLSTSSPSCLVFENVAAGVKSQMAEITKNLATAGKKVSYEKSALIFESAAKDLAPKMLTVKDPALKPLVQRLLAHLQEAAKSYRTRASLEASGDPKAMAKAKAETAAIYAEADKLNGEVYAICHP